MNIFFTGLNSSYEKYIKVLSSVESLKETFPELSNAQKFTYCSEDKRNFILLLCSPKQENEARVYFAENKDHILFYSGLPIDISQNINAHNSEDFLKNFDQIKYEYEGQASVIRYNKATHDTDIITDILGMEQVYYYNQGEELLISNFVKLIEIASLSFKIDITGASLFLSIGWVGDKFTLKENIHVMKGGEHWKWENNKKSFSKKVYFNPKEFKPASRKVLKKGNINNLYAEIENYLQILSKSFDFECALTGGFDSRLVAALLLDKNIKADYYTAGNPEHDDIRIASMIASKFNLPYRVYEIDYGYLFNNWDALVRNLILQNNGMASLWQIFNLMTHLDSVPSNNNKSKVRLSTQGAETARAAYNRTFLWGKKIKRKDVYIYLTNRVLENSYLLLTNLSIDLFYKFFDSFFKSLDDEGTNYRLAPDLFYVCERLGRHHANHLRINRTSGDIFSLFCTKIYMKTALQVHPIDKITFPFITK